MALRQDVADDEARLQFPDSTNVAAGDGPKKFGYTRRSIHPAPDAWVLKKFGGELTIDEFRDYTGKHEPCETILPPLLPTVMAVVQGEVSDVLRRLSVTQNNVVKKKKEKDKKGILHDYLKDNPHAEKSVVPAKRSATAAKKNEEGSKQ